MNNNSEQFRQFLHNETPVRKTDQPPAIKLKSRKTQIDLGHHVHKKVKVEEPNLMEKLQMNPIDLVKQATQYQFGNYQKYYTLRLHEKWNDPRMQVLDSVMFANKTVLDIGCNDGTVTLLIAMKFFPKLIRGIDIDYTLINKAVENMVDLDRTHHKIAKDEFKLQQEVDDVQPQDQQDLPPQFNELQERLSKLPKCFLKQVEEVAGDDIQRMYLNSQKTPTPNEMFPNNVYFRVENYIGNKEYNERYDTILCLSLTKWIHLNYGDQGIHRLFRKISKQLNAGGYLILEPQEWKSYKKKKYFSKEFKKNYNSIQLKPQDFARTLVAQYGMTLIQTIQPDDVEAIRLTKSTFKRSILILQKHI